jgi:AAA+ ATPase superfamily predicted ATPase
MKKFIDREEELKFLNGRYQNPEAQLIIIYGKRRIGKTELIKEFAKDKNSIYFICDKTTEKENLKNLGRIAGQKFNNIILTENGFRDFYQFFDFLKESLCKYLKESQYKNIIIAIDEFPYLYSSNTAIASIFQKGWDEILKELPVFLIICGSSISMMLKETINYSAPLYGRKTGQIFLKPLGFYDAWNFFPKLDFSRFLNIYAICGGIPLYLKQFIPLKSLTENLAENVFNKNSVLYNEGEIILSEELSELRIYFAILKALSLGKTKFGEIINYTGIAKTSMHKYLYVLEELQIIHKEVPVTEKTPEKSRKGVYKIIDPFFGFWFKFVLPFKSELEMGDLGKVLKYFHENFQSTITMVYQDLCREILRIKLNKVFKFNRIGRWWDVIGKQQYEIDLVAIDEENNQILFGEAKWSNKKVGINILEGLKEKSRFLTWNNTGRKEKFILFSKSGFTDELIRHTGTQEDLILVEKDEVLVVK